jgi:bis(5'-nucleosyl)-tetraphosphatase (symmetrical)
VSTYVIGDVQGCQHELDTLLRLIDFGAGRDRLWFTGDLVNRGPDSLAVLRFVRSLGDAATVVLGNHDLHLLACAAGVRQPHRKDTLGPVLEAPDRDELLHWLRHRPMLHFDDASGYLMIHAGLPPQWTAAQARQCAAELESVLRTDDNGTFFFNMYGNEPSSWSEQLEGWERLRFITNCLTRMRYCDAQGKLDFKEKGPPGSQPGTLIPWYRFPNRHNRDTPILFGHWATLRLTEPDTSAYNAWNLDTGCVWGGSLSAMRLEDHSLFSVPSD